MNNDLISRSALKKAVLDKTHGLDDIWNTTSILNLIDNAPTVEPFERIGLICEENCGYRPKGEWIDESRDSLLCTCCNKRVYKPFIGGFPTERSQHYYPNFCAFCGADMRKGGAK